MSITHRPEQKRTCTITDVVLLRTSIFYCPIYLSIPCSDPGTRAVYREKKRRVLREEQSSPFRLFSFSDCRRSSTIAPEEL